MSCVLDPSVMSRTDAENVMREAMLPIPDGYTRLAILATEGGTWLVIGGEGLPAMRLTGAPTTWERVLPVAAN